MQSFANIVVKKSGNTKSQTQFGFFLAFLQLLLHFGIFKNMDTSFQELKAKQVINTVDGKCLGHITDIVFDVATARALGFLVPEPNRGFWGMFKGNRDIFIPFDCVCKFGVDVILVELYVDEKGGAKCLDPKPCVDNKHHPPHRGENK